MTARERILALYSDPFRAPFSGAVAIHCDDCSEFIVWTNPPEPEVPTVCLDCG